jgi:hypothetical protein
LPKKIKCHPKDLSAVPSDLGPAERARKPEGENPPQKPKASTFQGLAFSKVKPPGWDEICVRLFAKLQTPRRAKALALDDSFWKGDADCSLPRVVARFALKLLAP